MAPNFFVASSIAMCFLGLGTHAAAHPPAGPNGHYRGHSAAPSHNAQLGASSTTNIAASSTDGVPTASTTTASIRPYTSAGFVAYSDMNSAQLQSVYNSYTSSVSESMNSGISSMSAQAAASCAGMSYVMSHYMSSMTPAATSTAPLSASTSAAASLAPRGALSKRAVAAGQQSCTATDGVDLGGNVAHYTVDIGLPFDNGGGCSAINNALGGMLSDVGFSFFSCNSLADGNDNFTELLFKVNIQIGNGAKIDAALESVTNGGIAGGFNCPDL